MQIWHSTILTTCRHSTECTKWREFQQDHIHHGRTEQRWVYGWDTASKNLDQTTLAQITPAPLMRKAATVRNTQRTLSGKTPMELAMDEDQGISWAQEQLTSIPTKQDLLNEMRTHLEVQQEEDIRRDLTDRMTFVPPDLRAREHLFYCCCYCVAFSCAH